VLFTPSLPDQTGSLPASVEHLSYGLGYMTLNESAVTIDGKLCRSHQYDVNPIRLDFTGTVTPAVVDITYHDDDGGDCFTFTVTASDLLINSLPAVSAYVLFLPLSDSTWQHPPLSNNVSDVNNYNLRITCV
jgi:hypothetical protein